MTTKIITAPKVSKETDEQLKAKAKREFDYLRAQRLSTHAFPNELLPDNFKALIHMALKWNSIRRINTNKFTYRNMVTFERPFMMPEMTLCLDMLRIATPVEMEQTVQENLDMLEKVVYKMEDEWNKIDDKVCEPIEREMTTKYLASLAVPAGKDLFRDFKNIQLK